MTDGGEKESRIKAKEKVEEKDEATAKDTVTRKARNEDGSTHTTKHMKPKRQKTSRLIKTRNGIQHSQEITSKDCYL